MSLYRGAAVDKVGRLAEALIDLDERLALRLVEELVAEGVGPMTILQAGDRGMEVIGERYERQEYFLSALIVAGEIFKEMVDLVRPGLHAGLEPQAVGRVLLGTVEGDIHDLGKNIVGAALTGFGFTILDLGVDVPPDRFVEEARLFRPQVVGLSGLLTQSIDTMRATVELLHAKADEIGFARVLIGGHIDERIASFVGADSWTHDAMEGVRICQSLINQDASANGATS